jgi:N-methylhydantoinase B
MDGVALALYEGLFASCAEEMGVTLMRTAHSPNIKERLDFSCAIFDARARLVAQAAHIPVHLGSMPRAVEAAIGIGPFRRGDTVLVNDPFAGGTHLPDLTLVSPVFLGRGAPAFFVASRAHHADVGGAAPGSMPLAREIYEEGFRAPPVLLARGDGFVRDTLALLLANVRTPHERRADLAAQLGAQRTGALRLAALAPARRTPRADARRRGAHGSRRARGARRDRRAADRPLALRGRARRRRSRPRPDPHRRASRAESPPRAPGFHRHQPAGGGPGQRRGAGDPRRRGLCAALRAGRRVSGQ